MQKSAIPKATPSGIQQNASAIQEDKQQVSLATLFEQLGSSEGGLTTQEARQRLQKFGPNEPTSVRRVAGIRQFLHCHRYTSSSWQVWSSFTCCSSKSSSAG